MSRINLIPTDVAGNKAINYAIYSKSQHNRVLELGPYDGTDTVFLSLKSKELIAIEGRRDNYFVIEKRLQNENITNVTLLVADLEYFDLKLLGLFDCVWASGIIYHMARPFLLISQIASITTECFGWTHLTPESDGTLDGYLGKKWSEDVLNPNGLAGLSSESWWLTVDGFIKIWNDLGWTCEYTTPPESHCNGGLAAQFWARKQA